MAHAHADLDEVVEGLYLEESAIAQVFQQLNTYARLHSTAEADGSQASLCRDLEAKIFRLLGLELRSPAPISLGR
ncbi:MAG: hypothetical protein HC824_14775 [Synechococcales cyanobacterium RM1_1_8]|nr:hypothetical protein [Synechococcales cyanobacterium RM1_1_8]